MALTTRLHLAQRLKKEYRYSSIALPCMRWPVSSRPLPLSSITLEALGIIFMTDCACCLVFKIRKPYRPINSSIAYQSHLVRFGPCFIRMILSPKRNGFVCASLGIFLKRDGGIFSFKKWIQMHHTIFRKHNGNFT